MVNGRRPPARLDRGGAGICAAGSIGAEVGRRWLAKEEKEAACDDEEERWRRIRAADIEIMVRDLGTPSYSRSEETVQVSSK